MAEAVESHACGCTANRDAETIVKVARWRSRVPILMDAFERGELSLEQVAAAIEAPPWADVLILDFRTIAISRDADVFDDVVFTGAYGDPIAPTTRPVPPTGPPPSPRVRYRSALAGRVDWNWVGLGWVHPEAKRRRLEQLDEHLAARGRHPRSVRYSCGPVNAEVGAYIDRSGQWPGEMRRLRTVLLRCGLAEEFKWGKPCYGHDGHNIVIVQEMKDFLALMFFKGALLTDPAGVLEAQGPNSRSARRICFRSIADVERMEAVVEEYLAEAVAVEQAGLEVGPAPELVPVAELQARLDRDPALRAAFESLTPGRRREYYLHISDAKQASTREARIERLAPQILAGKGLRDR
jgi:uncharacterized protein YdeI (YjbR/CyaY-like superfamily)